MCSLQKIMKIDEPNSNPYPNPEKPIFLSKQGERKINRKLNIHINLFCEILCGFENLSPVFKKSSHNIRWLRYILSYYSELKMSTLSKNSLLLRP